MRGRTATRCCSAPTACSASNPHLYSRMPVDLRKAFVPVANLVTNMVILAVNPDKVPSKTFGEFIEFARKANPPLFYASIGNGSQHHIAMELLKRTAKIDLTHVPYKGGGPAGIATVGGETVAMFGGGAVVPLVRSGKLRALAVSSSEAFAELCRSCRPSPRPIPGIRSRSGSKKMLAPAGTPPEVVSKLRTEVQEVLKLPGGRADAAQCRLRRAVADLGRGVRRDDRGGLRALRQDHQGHRHQGRQLTRDFGDAPPASTLPARSRGYVE